MTSTTKLPRVPHADGPRPEETIYKRTGADLQNGWLARHGNLHLTDTRLLFAPTLLDTALGAKRREIALDAVVEVERWPKSPGQIPPGGRRPRMRIHTDPVVYEFLVGDLDAWIDAVQKVYQLREKRGQGGPCPPITREGYENLLLADE